MNPINKPMAPRNRSIRITPEQEREFAGKTIMLSQKSSMEAITGKTICQDVQEALPLLPERFIDLLFVDPPYNIDKKFNGFHFRKMDDLSYEEWLDNWMQAILPALNPTASIYVCCEWLTSGPVYNVLKRMFKVRNRITWEREKGRGALSNWKNCSEDIWFATMSDDYTFNTDAVKIKRKVLAPYRDKERKPKDWIKEDEGNYRLTFPSNLWTDITVPFWSMPENTEHPTQKPEKLVAKIILASSNAGDFVFDPFLGSGTTSVVAKKLGRAYCGIERDIHYAALSEYRLALAEECRDIQGYDGNVFWERNSSK